MILLYIYMSDFRDEFSAQGPSTRVFVLQVSFILTHACVIISETQCTVRNGVCIVNVTHINTCMCYY
jgi:hypothetical protein